MEGSFMDPQHCGPSAKSWPWLDSLNSNGESDVKSMIFFYSKRDLNEYILIQSSNVLSAGTGQYFAACVLLGIKVR